jgi:hypothetical protein
MAFRYLFVFFFISFLKISQQNNDTVARLDDRELLQFNSLKTLLKDVDSLRLRIKSATTSHKARMEVNAALGHLARMGQSLRNAGIQRRRELIRNNINVISI